MSETTLIQEVYWYARCACGAFLTSAPLPAGVAVDKVKTHLLAFHAHDGADVQITGVMINRRADTLPATGVLPDAAGELARGAQRLSVMDRAAAPVVERVETKPRKAAS